MYLKGDRTYTKIAIISSMYGSKKIPEVEKLFALNEWCKQLEADVKDGIIPKSQLSTFQDKLSIHTSKLSTLYERKVPTPNKRSHAVLAGGLQWVYKITLYETHNPPAGTA